MAADTQDMGNTNFSIILPRTVFTRAGGAQLVAQAVRERLSVPSCTVNERNDVVIRDGGPELKVGASQGGEGSVIDCDCKVWFLPSCADLWIEKEISWHFATRRKGTVRVVQAAVPFDPLLPLSLNHRVMAGWYGLRPFSTQWA